MCDALFEMTEIMVINCFTARKPNALHIQSLKNIGLELGEKFKSPIAQTLLDLFTIHSNCFIMGHKYLIYSIGTRSKTCR
jgi:hypothetical protein